MMRRWSSLLLTAAVAGLMWPAETEAQTRKRPRRGGGLSGNFARGPAVGEKLPDVTAYDAEGKPFRLSSLKGSHTVLVFGCLT